MIDQDGYRPNVASVIINEDNKILKYKKYMKLKKDKGKVVLINNKKYVELNNNIYDYNSYKNAGILLKMPIVK